MKLAKLTKARAKQIAEFHNDSTSRTPLSRLLWKYFRLEFPYLASVARNFPVRLCWTMKRFPLVVFSTILYSSFYFSIFTFSTTTPNHLVSILELINYIVWSVECILLKLFSLNYSLWFQLICYSWERNCCAGKNIQSSERDELGEWTKAITPAVIVLVLESIVHLIICNVKLQNRFHRKTGGGHRN